MRIFVIHFSAKHLTTFTELGIEASVVKALDEIKITSPTDIQSKVIPFLLNNERDLLAVAHTGTGKTAAFGLPLLQQIDVQSQTFQALILCPTRELAQQTASHLRQFGKYLKGFHVVALYGGTDIEKQIDELDRFHPQVIVSTPGRFIDLLNQDMFDLDFISHFIMDEADEMLRKGFREDMDYIRSGIEHPINTWMFCATKNPEVSQLMENFLEEGYHTIQSNPDNALNPDIEHQYMVCKLDQKREGLRFFLRIHADKNGIVFCRTKAAVDEITAYLQKHGFSAAAIHSDLTQKERDAVMNRFKGNSLRVLVATDIAARGLDVKGLGFVIHFHLPEQREYFNHRSGRTGRAGNKGISLCIVFQKEVKKINAIANNLGLLFTKVEFAEQDIAENDAYQDAEAKHENTSDKPSDASTNQEFAWFYINMGKADDVNRKNLVDFICGEAGLKPSDFGMINIEKKRAHFQVHQSAIRKLVAGLKNIVVDGKNLVLTRSEFENE